MPNGEASERGNADRLESEVERKNASLDPEPSNRNTTNGRVMGSGGGRSDEPSGDRTETENVRSDRSSGEASNGEDGSIEAGNQEVDSGSDPDPASGSGSDPDRSPESQRSEGRDPESRSSESRSLESGTADPDDGFEWSRNEAPGSIQNEDSGATGAIRRFLSADRGPAMWVREVATSVLIVLLVGLLLFGVSGVWPPMVAVESGSMDPNMVKGDLIVVTDPGRFAPEAATNDRGIVSYERGEDAGYRSFGTYGSVVVFSHPGRIGSPIIHRARFHVEGGENWVDRADERYLGSQDCSEITHCPAPHSGYITKGDANSRYDQVNGVAPPVRSEWITGVARVRIPYLGWLRLIATGEATTEEFFDTVIRGQGTVASVPDPGGFEDFDPIDGIDPVTVTVGGAAAITYGRVRGT